MKITATIFGMSVFGMAGAAMLASSAAEAKPGGCLKYGVAGAVTGHYAGHHAVKAAVAGCALGMVRRHEYKKQLREERTHQNRAVTPASH